MLLILGAIPIVVGLALFTVRVIKERWLRRLRYAESASAGVLKLLASGIGEALGEPGHFRQLAEIAGIVRCDAPLIAEVSVQPWVYYASTVTREYEEMRGAGSRQRGRKHLQTRRRREVISQNSQNVPFWVEDATGRVLIDLRGARIEPIKVVDRFDPIDRTLSTASWRELAVDIVRSLAIANQNTPVLGHHLREESILVGQRVYVLGEASDSAGELSIQLPETHGRPFVVSTRSKAEIMRSTANTTRWILMGAVGSIATGLVLIALGLLA